MAGRLPQQAPMVPPQELATSGASAPAAARASPFASGPVAMVNQTPPGFGTPGQFPGHAVRTAPTQLSTPLVPQRHLSSSLSNSASEPTPSIFTDSQAPHPQSTSDLFGQATPPPSQTGSDLFGQSSSQQQRYQSTPDPFGSPSGPAPPFQMQQAHTEMTSNVERALTDNLFGPPSAPTPPGRVNQRNSYQNLFGSPQAASTSTGNASKLAPVRRSSLSFSQGQTPPPSGGAHSSQAQPRLQHQSNPYQQQQQPPQRAFGQPPPPAAPFLGYGDNARSQSFRAPATTGPTYALQPSDPRQSFSPARPAPVSTPTPAPPPPRITLEAPSPDDLLEEFLKMSLDERFAGTQITTPPPSKLLLADIPDSIESLEALYAQKRWKSLTKKSLSMLQSPSKDPNVTLEIKSWWLAGLIKEGQYDNAASVLDQIGNLDEVSFDGGNAFVPIRLRLLQALLSKCQGKSAIHEKQLFHLVTRLRSALQQNETVSLLGVGSEAAARWLRIAQFALVNHLVHQQKFTLALRVCSKIDVETLKDEEKVIVLSRVGRVRVQMGDLATAEKLFEAARSLTTQLKATSTIAGPSDAAAKVVAELEARVLLNDGLLLFAQNKLQEALSAFDSVLYLQHAQTVTAEGSDAQLFLEEDLVCAAVNNYAICALYCCDVKAAVAALERMIRSNPQRFLSGVVVFNLSSLYDLIYDNSTSKSRKEMMKKIAHLYDLEHIDPAAYRI